jgi:hypothetical protein
MAFNVNEAPLTRREDCLQTTQDAFFLLNSRHYVTNPMAASLSGPALQDLLNNEDFFRANAESYTSCRDNPGKQLSTSYKPRLATGVSVVVPMPNSGERTRERITERQIFSTEGRWGSSNGPRLPNQDVSVGIDTRREFKEAWKKRHGSATSAKRGLSTLSSQVVSAPAPVKSRALPATPSDRQITFGELLFAERVKMTK